MGKKKKKKIKKKKIRIKYKNVFIFLLVFLSLCYLINLCLKIRITNIYIKGNKYLKDQEIIELAGVQNYPKVIDTLSFKLKDKIEKNSMIDKVEISHKFRTLIIKVEENTPLYYDNTKGKTILKNKEEVSEKYNTPVLLNYIPDKKQKRFHEEMVNLPENIRQKISEIKYDPNEKDDERFLLSMNDGNYVYLSLYKFDRIHQYLDIMLEINTKFNNQKGILYLDSGDYFKVIG